MITVCLDTEGILYTHNDLPRADLDSIPGRILNAKEVYIFIFT